MAEKRTRTGNRGSFQPGHSGNPGGRPRELHDVRALARAHTADAVERLLFWMRSDNPKASVTASVALLDRAWGRPPQALHVSGEGGGPLIQRVIHEDAHD